MQNKVSVLEKGLLKSKSLEVEYFHFRPQDQELKGLALFTHGYTSHKGSILSWGQRLADFGIATLLFDLPGHYLGSFREAPSFDEFTADAPTLFEAGLKKLQTDHPQAPHTLFMGGHSLGALISLKASVLPCFEDYQTTCFVVGFGLAPEKGKHVFESDFYKATLDMRRQLVSPSLAPESMFPWIWDQKWHLQLSHHKIIFLTGKDDVVVATDGSERLAEQLERLGNEVLLIRPTRLPHHMPELAASHILAQVKKIFK